MAKNFRDRAGYYLAYARRHPGDCLLHSFKRHKLLRELEDLAIRIKAFAAPLNSDAYALQCECTRTLWDGYFGLKSWFYITSTDKLEAVKRDMKAKVSEIERLLA